MIGSIRPMGRFETDIFMQPQNFKLLMNLQGAWVNKVHPRKHKQEDCGGSLERF